VLTRAKSYNFPTNVLSKEQSAVPKCAFVNSQARTVTQKEPLRVFPGDGFEPPTLGAPDNAVNTGCRGLTSPSGLPSYIAEGTGHHGSERWYMHLSKDPACPSEHHLRICRFICLSANLSASVNPYSIEISRLTETSLFCPPCE
jgi:hypothetical protein